MNKWKQHKEGNQVCSCMSRMTGWGTLGIGLDNIHYLQYDIDK